MTKHIFGFILFSLIVSGSIFIYAFFNVPAIVQVAEVNEISARPFIRAKNSCKTKRSEKMTSIEVKQAIYDLQTRQLKFELATPDIDESVDLHFFAKDEKGNVRYITSEQVSNAFSYNNRLRYINYYNWLNKQNLSETLYMSAQFASETTNYRENFQVNGNKYQPKFNASKATPITVSFGE